MRFKMIIYSLILFIFPLSVYAATESLIFTDKGTMTRVTVTRIVDGDTISIQEQGNSDNVRLLGVNTPETTNNKNEPWGATATAFTSTLLNKEIELWISANPKQHRDDYNRRLGVIVYEGQIFNARLISEGLATRLLMENALLNYPLWEDIEIEARRGKKGLWQHLGSKRVVINEINPDPAGHDSKGGSEFVELYNLGTQAVNLKDWTLGRPEQTTFPDLSIPARGYLIVAQTSTQRFREIYPQTPSNAIIVEAAETLQLSNTFRPIEGQVLYLKDAVKAYQDALVYNLNWDNKGANDSGKSIERIDSRIANLGDSQVNGADDLNWSPCSATPTPGYRNSLSPKLLCDFGRQDLEEPDEIIDFNDLVWFSLYWHAYHSNHNDLRGDITGPSSTTSGSLPDLVTQPDGIVDFEDLMVFTLIWNWWHQDR